MAAYVYILRTNSYYYGWDIDGIYLNEEDAIKDCISYIKDRVSEDEYEDLEEEITENNMSDFEDWAYIQAYLLR